MVGRTRKDLEDENFTLSAILAPGFEQYATLVDDELQRSGTAAVREVGFQHYDGSTGTMLAGAVGNGSVIGFTLDITPLRDAELLRARSARELEGSLRARDDFVSLLAHELRNPLTPLIMQLESLSAAASSAETLAGPWVAEQLAIAHRAVLRLTKLSEDLLQVSAATVGGFRLELAEVDLSKLVAEVVARTHDELARAHCEVFLRTKPVTGQWDRDALERVIVHLLSNAIKYAPCAPIEIDVVSDEANATLTIRDHGVGLSAAEQETLFHRFSRLAPIQHHGGLGVGLWLVRRIIEAHGGKVSIEPPHDGGGARFVVELPRQPAASQRRMEDRMSEEHTHAKILLVDDDDDIREILHRGLTDAGHDVRDAANGEEALSALAEGVPDIVLLDMMMPVMSGPQFLERVRDDERYRTMPVVALTAWPAEAKPLRGLRAVLGKPVDFTQLLNTIDSAVH